jgi:hypothetical protein
VRRFDFLAEIGLGRALGDDLLESAHKLQGESEDQKHECQNPFPQAWKRIFWVSFGDIFRTQSGSDPNCESLIPLQIWAKPVVFYPASSERRRWCNFSPKQDQCAGNIQQEANGSEQLQVELPYGALDATVAISRRISRLISNSKKMMTSSAMKIAYNIADLQGWEVISNKPRRRIAALP